MEGKKGFVHIYTGNGKGKTTSAIGLAIRALGAGYRVFIAQFIKNKLCNEHKILQSLSPRVEIRQYGCGFIFGNKPSQDDINEARKGLDEIRDIVDKGIFDLIILDEANVAVHYNLFSVEDLLDVINNKQESTEIVITGRYAHKGLIDRADLVTEMVCVKHYFQHGIKARQGIEE